MQTQPRQPEASRRKKDRKFKKHGRMEEQASQLGITVAALRQKLAKEVEPFATRGSKPSHVSAFARPAEPTEPSRPFWYPPTDIEYRYRW
jgi:hypothetical protein